MNTLQLSIQKKLKKIELLQIILRNINRLQEEKNRKIEEKELQNLEKEIS